MPATVMFEGALLLDTPPQKMRGEAQPRRVVRLTPALRGSIASLMLRAQGALRNGEEPVAEPDDD